jgi:RimJ/RimL family protein N-acetyltransferase
MTILETPRLRLEPLDWPHLDGFHAMNARPEVMRFLSDGVPETLDESRLMIERVRQRWAHFGYSWWALNRQGNGAAGGRWHGATPAPRGRTAR